MKSAAIALLSAFAIFAAPPAFAYQEAGHLFTVNLVVNKVAPGLGLPASDLRVITFCAQLPDESSDLDAIGVYKHLLGHGLIDWAFGNKVSTDEARDMVTVQQLLHALTGGDAITVQGVASKVLKNLAAKAVARGTDDHTARLCALGFAFHLYGDSFAHQMMAGNSNDPTAMYPTGRGHFADNYYPDVPLCSKLLPNLHPYAHCESTPDDRFKAWAVYWADAAKYLSPRPGGEVPKALHDQIIAEIYALKDPAPNLSVNSKDCDGEAEDSNYWKEICVQQYLAKADTGADAIKNFFSAQPDELPCREVVAKAQAAGLLPSAVGEINMDICGDASEAFFTESAQDFLNTSGSRAAISSFPDTDYTTHPLR